MDTSTADPRARSHGRAVLALVTLLYLGFVGFFTLAPIPWLTATDEGRFGAFTPRLWLEPSTWTSGSIVEFVANIIMFVPIGLLLRLVFHRVSGWAVLAIAATVTVAIEALQLPLERVSDPRDLVANTVGAAIGIALGAAILATRARVRATHELSA